MSAAVQIADVAKAFAGRPAVDGVSLDVAAGSFVVLLGPSGAGKSTLLRSVNGLVTPDAGSVTVDGLPVARKTLREVRRRVGLIFQQFNLVGRLSVMTNVLTGRLAHVPAWMSLLHLFPRQDIDIAAAALEQVGLSEKAWDRADRLSGGQQQRVAVARTLAQGPRVVLADEPIASLDPRTGRAVMDLLRDACRDRGITLIVSLHQVDVAREYADRVVGMNDGRVVFDGPPADFDDDAVHEVYAAGPSKLPEQL